MKADVVLCGVGGQGVLSAAAILAQAALHQGLEVRQGEVHGMSQRGGAVQAMLRMSDAPIPGELIPRGTADLLVSLEPVEALRYLDWLGPEGWVLTAAEPFRNIDPYPELAEVHARLRSLPRVAVLEAEKLARASGSVRAANVVLVGAAVEHLPLDPEGVRAVIDHAFREKGPRIVEANQRAFQAGRTRAAGSRTRGAGA